MCHKPQISSKQNKMLNNYQFERFTHALTENIGDANDTSSCSRSQKCILTHMSEHRRTYTTDQIANMLYYMLWWFGVGLLVRTFVRSTKLLYIRRASNGMGDRFGFNSR